MTPFWRRVRPASGPDASTGIPPLFPPAPTIEPLFARPPLIEPAALVPPLWRFGRRGEPWMREGLRFLPDGRIAGSGHENESRWRLQDGSLFLGTSSGLDTTRFDAWSAIDRRPAMTGPFLADPTGINVLSENRDDLHAVRWLRNPSRPLLVVFNNHGAPFDGRDTRWALYRLTERREFDHLRFAERVDPHFWYLNKTGRVLAELRHVVALGYREFGFYGTSSGGYASMLFAELLGAAAPDLRIRSVVVNPQAVHGPRHEERLRSEAPPQFLPAMIEPDALLQADIRHSGIHEIVAARPRPPPDGTTIEHRVLYDAANPAEAFQIAFLDGLPGFDLRPHALGVSHPDGILAMQEQALADVTDWLLAT